MQRAVCGRQYGRVLVPQQSPLAEADPAIAGRHLDIMGEHGAREWGGGEFVGMNHGCVHCGSTSRPSRTNACQSAMIAVSWCERERREIVGAEVADRADFLFLDRRCAHPRHLAGIDDEDDGITGLGIDAKQMRQADGQAEFLAHLALRRALHLLTTINISRWKGPQAASRLHRPLLQEDAALVRDNHRRRHFRIADRWGQPALIARPPSACGCGRNPPACRCHRAGSRRPALRAPYPYACGGSGARRCRL